MSKKNGQKKYESIIEAMKQRKNASPILDVSFPSSEDPEVTLQVERWSPTEWMHAQNEARRKTRGHDYDEETFREEFQMALVYETFLLLKKHIKDWDGPEGFTPKDFLDSLSLGDAQLLGANYLAAISEDQTKSGKGSGKHSDEQSSSA